MKKKYKVNYTWHSGEYFEARTDKETIVEIDDGSKLLHDFSPVDNVFIDCSASEGLIGVYSDTTIIERYVPDDFDESVTDLNYVFAQNKK